MAPTLIVYGDTLEPIVREMTDAEQAQLEDSLDQGLAEPASANEVTLRDRAEQAITTLENAHAGWASLTAAQKDGALRLTVRVVVALARLVLRRLDSA